jgi:hypothetical protein
MNKWGELIKYLNSKKAKPEAVMNMVKAVYDRKSTVAPERTAWKVNVVIALLNRTEKTQDGKIWGLVNSKNKSYVAAYNTFHKKYRYKDKTETQHFNACKKIWQSNKLLRTRIKRLTPKLQHRLQRHPTWLAKFIK